ncbi:MAG: ABC transporter ATP-binding protein [Mycoplasmataceae bacterium]|jgi:simple sugar transport system ATP-binding protein|nr:ABC transporter ATP-binding protein [Mycoplasmataceae bacterium]
MKNNILSEIKNLYSKSPFAVELENITKTFSGGKIVANDKINLKVRTNTIHAIVGENGAGKTTLMSILFGLYKQDSGTIKINGKEVSFKNANDASKSGIGMVHQHFMLVNVFTVLQNIMLGCEKTNFFGIIDSKTSRNEITKIINKFNLQVDLDKQIKDCSVSEQQKTEILKLLYRNCDILIFDEPTAVLNDEEISLFLKTLQTFKSEGKTIILITHKLNEVKEVADDISIIRLGKNVDSFENKNVNLTELANLMIGKEIKFVQKPIVQTNFTKTVLELENVSLKSKSDKKKIALKNISLSVAAGEILGVAGIEGNGQNELALAINGLLEIESGKITLNNEEISGKSVNYIAKDKISYIPENRMTEGIVLDETIAYNCVLKELSDKRFSRWGFLRKQNIKNYALDICNKFDVRGFKSIDSQIGYLSGGNQQKLVIGREITKKHSLIIFNQPTRGVDLGAVQFIHSQILADAQKGNGVILISYELDELLRIADRIVVFSKGEIIYNSPIGQTNKETIGLYISGQRRGNE